MERRKFPGKERQDRIEQELWRFRRTISLSMMSASGAGLLLTIATPIQLIGRVREEYLYWVFHFAIIFIVVFGSGVTFAFCALHEASAEDFDNYRRWSRLARRVLIGSAVAIGTMLAAVGALIKFFPGSLSASA